MAPARKYDPMRFVDPERAKKQAKINKERGNRMERDVAKFFNQGRELVSRRTPMSGAGWIKGDNHIPLSSPPAFFVISCKTSEAEHELHGPYIPLHIKWLQELERDTNAMRSIGCRFGALVVKYHGRRKEELFTFLHTSDLDILARELNYAPERTDQVIDLRYLKNGKPKVTARLFRNRLLETYGATYLFAGAEMVLVKAQDIREALWLSDERMKDDGI